MVEDDREVHEEQRGIRVSRIVGGWCPHRLRAQSVAEPSHPAELEARGGGQFCYDEVCAQEVEEIARRCHSIDGHRAVRHRSREIPGAESEVAHAVRGMNPRIKPDRPGTILEERGSEAGRVDPARQG